MSKANPTEAPERDLGKLILPSQAFTEDALLYMLDRATRHPSKGVRESYVKALLSQYRALAYMADWTYCETLKRDGLVTEQELREVGHESA